MVLRYLIIFALQLIVVHKGINQPTAIIDSLTTQLSNVKNDSIKAELLNDLSFQMLQSNIEKAKEYALNACEISTRLNLKKGRADCLVRLGTISIVEANFNEAEKYLNEALKEREKLGVVSDIVSVYNLLGLLFYHKNNDEKAIEYYGKCLEIDKKEPISLQSANIYNNISNSYRRLGNYKKAIEFINKGIETNSLLGNELGGAKLLFTLGNWYSEIRNYAQAYKNFELTIDVFKRHEKFHEIANCYINMGNCQFYLGRYDKALELLNVALKTSEFLDEERIANIYRTKGNIFRSKNQLEKAIESFEKSLRGFINIKNDAEIASLYYNIGLLKKDNSEFDEAMELFLKSESILDTIEDPLLELSLCQEISQTYLKLGNIENAIDYSFKHDDLQDSLDENYRRAINYKMSYEEEKKKNERLKNELRVKELIIQKKAIEMRSFIGLGIGLFILSILVLLYINYKRRSKRQLKSKNQEIDILLRDQEVKTTYAKLEGQDEERKRIAQDLHDRVGSILSTVKLYFDGFNSKLDTMHSQSLENHGKANELLDEAVSEVRKIAQNIHSGTLTKFGLKAELEALSELLIESKKIDIQITTFGLEERLPVALEIKIYRIIQELVSNILKHAKATKINIQLNQFKEVINIIVQDNGIGFDEDKVKEKDGMGLKSIRSRVYNLHGSIIIDTGKGSGTTVTIDIPREK